MDIPPFQDGIFYSSQGSQSQEKRHILVVLKTTNQNQSLRIGGRMEKLLLTTFIEIVSGCNVSWFSTCGGKKQKSACVPREGL